MEDTSQHQFEATALLRNPLRRSLYNYVRSRGHEVGRDEAARAVGAGREVVASHLDKLAEIGLLEVSFRRLGERRGPGAGRPAKMYRASGRGVELSVPPRRYRLLAELFAGAIEDSDGDVEDALQRKARELGRSLGRRAGQAVGAAASREEVLAALMSVLSEHGYEPVREGQQVVLGNCPFRALIDAHAELVCHVNLVLVASLIEGLQGDGMPAAAVAPDGRCCVVVRLGGSAWEMATQALKAVPRQPGRAFPPGRPLRLSRAP